MRSSAITENSAKARDDNLKQLGEINQCFLAVDVRNSPDGRKVGAAFINLNQREMLLTEFLDNEHFSSLESLVI